MAGETVITVVGNLTSDPELRQVGGATVANFTVASTPRTFDKASNEWKDGEALFLRCSAWRELGDHIGSSLTKGTRVIVQGRLTMRAYEKDGVKRTSTELEVDAIGPELRYATVSVERAGGNKNQAARQQQFQQQAQPQRQQQQQQQWAPAAYDDETPF